MSNILKSLICNRIHFWICTSVDIWANSPIFSPTSPPDFLSPKMPLQKRNSLPQKMGLKKFEKTYLIIDWILIRINNQFWLVFLRSMNSTWRANVRLLRHSSHRLLILLLLVQVIRITRSYKTIKLAIVSFYVEFHVWGGFRKWSFWFSLGFGWSMIISK